MRPELAASRSSRAGVTPPTKAEWAGLESRGRTSVSGAELATIRLEARAAKRSTAVARAGAPTVAVPAPAVVIRKLQRQVARLQDENARLKVAAMTLVRS